jgi:hypothetical protein
MTNFNKSLKILITHSYLEALFRCYAKQSLMNLKELLLSNLSTRIELIF